MATSPFFAGKLAKSRGHTELMIVMAIYFYKYTKQVKELMSAYTVYFKQNTVYSIFRNNKYNLLNYRINIVILSLALVP